MALSKTKGSEIIALVSVVPKNTEDNLNLSDTDNKVREQLVDHTGIRYRKRIAQKDTSVKDLFREAIDKLLEKLSWKKEEIDILICVTQTPEVAIPSISCQLHGDMGFYQHVMCYDINSGCSGFVYGLQTVQSLLSSMDKKHAKAILCCGDVSSSLINPSDPSVKPIFSDAVSAVAIESKNDEVGGYFNLETDGSGQNAICMSKGDKKYMTLNGIDVFSYSVKLVPDNIRRLLSYAEKDLHFPDLFVFHQANKIINESIRKNLKIEEDKVPYTLYKYGNTASASIPLTLGVTWNNEISKTGWVLISGFGVGFSVASALIKFNPIFCELPMELDL